jgi:hypothetical protein
VAFALALVVFAGAVVLAGLLAEFVVVEFDVVVLVVAGVLTGATLVVLALLAGLLAFELLLAASPQAIPKALIARTVESTITFFIFITNSYLSQRICLLPGVRQILHRRFCPELFLFRANVTIEIGEPFVNLNNAKNRIVE